MPIVTFNMSSSHPTPHPTRHEATSIINPPTKMLCTALRPSMPSTSPFTQLLFNPTPIHLNTCVPPSAIQRRAGCHHRLQLVEPKSTHGVNHPVEGPPCQIKKHRTCKCPHTHGGCLHPSRARALVPEGMQRVITPWFAHREMALWFMKFEDLASAADG